MGDPDCGGCSSIPSARTSARRRSGAWIPTSGSKVLDAEGIDAAILYTTVGLLWEAEVEDPELSQAVHPCVQPVDLRVLLRSDASYHRAPVADDPGGGRAELERAVEEGARRYVAPFTHGASRAAIPITIWCSPPRKPSAFPSRSTRRSSRSGPRARGWARGRT